MADTVIDRMVVALIADISNLTNGYKNAQRATDNLSDELNDLERDSKSVSDSLESSGRSAEQSGRGFDSLSSSVDGTSSSAGQAETKIDGLADSLDKEKQSAQQAGDATENLGNKTENAGNESEKSEKKTDGFSGSLSNLKVWAAAAAAAVAAVAGASIKAADNFYKAQNTIRIGTGATGTSLDDLLEEYNNIVGTVGMSSDQIATAISDLNTVYGLQGDELEMLTRQYLALSKVTEGDVSSQIAKARAVFNKFKVGVEDQADTLDYFFRICQNSNVQMDDLLSALDSGDRGFQLLGLSAKESAAVVGSAIINDGLESANELASAMETGLARMASKLSAEVSAATSAYADAEKEYEAALASGDNSALSDASIKLAEARERLIKSQSVSSSAATEQALTDLIETMRNAKDETEATNEGLDIFGTRLSGKVAGALHGGSLAFQDLADSAESGDTLRELADKTMTLGDKLTNMAQRVEKSLVPLGKRLLDMLDEFMPTFEKVMGYADLFFGSLADGSAESVMSFHPLMQVLSTFRDWWDENSEVIIAGCAVIWEKIQELWTQIEPYVTGACDILNTLIDGTLGTILDLITLAFALIAGDNEKIAETVLDINISLMKMLALLVEGGINMIIDFIETSLNNLLQFAVKIANSLVYVVESAINSAVDWANSFIKAWNDLAALTGLPSIGFSFKRAELPTISVDPIKIDRVTMISDRIDDLETQYDQLLAAQAEAREKKESEQPSSNETTVINNTFNTTVNAPNAEYGKQAGLTASREWIRESEAGGGRG